jgi:hypothetical protein
MLLAVVVTTSSAVQRVNWFAQFNSQNNVLDSTSYFRCYVLELSCFPLDDFITVYSGSHTS